MTTSHVSLPDFSEYLNLPGHLENEEEQWAAREFYKKNAAALQQVMDETKAVTVLELGCGSGWIPLSLASGFYTGVDNNDGCLALCHQKNPNVPFVKADLRYLPRSYTADVVACFAVLKHFGLHEWDSVLKSVLRRGKHALFTMQVAPEDMDDGVDYHHTWVTEQHLKDAIKAAGHTLVSMTVSAVAENGAGVEFLIRTKQG